MTGSTAEPPALVDTNIIIYAYDPEDPVKHAVAAALLKKLSDDKRLLLSAQVFNEFCSVMMKPRRKDRLSPQELLALLRRLASTGQLLPVSAELTFRALIAMPKHGMSFWDALIWAAAAEHGAAAIYTVDFQDGREIEGIRFVNPFKSSYTSTPE
jgi:predicted nucleic acid-binding protein